MAPAPQKSTQRGSQAAKAVPSKSAARPANKSAAKAAPANKANGGTKAAARPKVEKPIKHCLDGCGAQTKGGDFVIGHDAKLKSVLQKAHVAGETAINLGGADKSRYHGKAPMEIAKERGWEKFLDKAKAAADEKANRPARKRAAAKGGPIEADCQVQFNYRGAKRTGKVVEVGGERAKVEFDVDGKVETRAFGKESLTRVG